MRKHDLHTHSRISDGNWQPYELAEIARNRDLEIVGISDHAFSSKLPDKYQITNRLLKYVAFIQDLKDSLTDLDLKIGIEIDVSQNCGTDPKQLPFEELNSFDYILFEYVNTEYETWGRVGSRDISEIVSIRDKLKTPVGLAHNDLQRNFSGREKEIAKILSDNDIFLELNQSENGRNSRQSQNYYHLFSPVLLSRLKQYDVKVVIGTDSHFGESIGDIDDATSFVEQNKLSYHPLVL